MEKDAPISRAVELAGDIFFAAQFSAAYITNMSGFDLRQVQNYREATVELISRYSSQLFLEYKDYRSRDMNEAAN